jgi:adenylate cyclase
MGDGALIEFASVVDAVECAAAIQKGVAERQAEVPKDQRIAFRIGINIGDVIIEGDDIYGDGVNVAARLEALAEPGEICVSCNVYNQVKSCWRGAVAWARTGARRPQSKGRWRTRCPGRCRARR